MRSRQRWALIAFVLLLGFVGLAVSTPLQIFQGKKSVTMTELAAMVDRREVSGIVFRGQKVVAKLPDGSVRTVVGPEDPDYYIAYFTEKGLVPEFERPDDRWIGFLELALPLVLCGMMLYLMIQRADRGEGRAISFGRSRAKMSGGGSGVTFSDVAGCEEAKAELEEIILFLKDPKRFGRLGGRIPKGVLLMGGPGAGKTLLARAVAGEAGVAFFSLSGSEFVEMFVGVGASRVRDLFAQARKQSPCIVFIDEIDAIGRHRGGVAGGGQEERDQTLNQLLVEMDGFEANDTVILMAATNRPDVLDPALLRPGRFDRRVVVPPPDMRGRAGILAVHARKVPLAPSVDLDRIAKGTPGFCGADLENLINEAALLAARADKQQVEQADLEQAKDKVAMGAERRSLVLSDEMKRLVAYHETGHALVAWMSKNADPVNKISIVPRGRALGITQYLPDEDRVLTQSRLVATLAWMLGGRAAEEVTFGDVSTGAQDDIRRATQLARAMVCDYGMSDLGMVALGSEGQTTFLGAEARVSDYSQATAERIDKEVRRLLDSAYATAKLVLTDNRHILDHVAKVLLDRETLDGAEFDRIVADLLPVVSRVAEA